jgi:hypothetical protein
LVEGVKAGQQLIHPHKRAASRSRQEGFEAKDEQAINFNISSTEYMSGGTAVHVDSKTKAARNEKQSGVRKFHMN